MGFGIGVGMGWGARGNNSAVLGYFNLLSTCSGGPFPPDQFFSQQLLQTDFLEGDYVTDPKKGDRILLGAFVKEIPNKSTIIQIEGPVYKDCKK